MFYSPTEKLIYGPPVGPPQDPLAVHRSLVRLSAGRINDWIADWSADDMLVRAEAEEQLVSATRRTFGFKPATDADGISDSQVLAVLEDFLRWCEGKV